MFRASVSKTNGLHLYISEGTNPAARNEQEKPMLQRMPSHGLSQDNSCALREKHKEEVVHATPVREFPTVNLHEDNDLEFSEASNHVVIDQSIGADHVVDEIMYDPTVEDEIAFDRCEHAQVGRNTTIVSNKEQNRATQNKNLEPSYKAVDVNIEDTMVPKEYLIETLCGEFGMFMLYCNVEQLVSVLNISRLRLRYLVEISPKNFNWEARVEEVATSSASQGKPKSLWEELGTSSCNFFKWCDTVTCNGVPNVVESSCPTCSCGAGKCNLLTENDGKDAGRKYFACRVKKALQSIDRDISSSLDYRRKPRDGVSSASAFYDAGSFIFRSLMSNLSGLSTAVGARPNPNKSVEVTQPPTDSVSSLCFSPEGNFLVATSWDNQVRCWEILQTGSSVPKAVISHDQPVLCSAWKDDGTAVFSGGCDKHVKMWPLMSGGQPITVAVHDAPVKELAWVPEMNLLVTGSWDKTLRYWDTRQPNPVHIQQLSERCYALTVRHPLMVVGTARSEIWLFLTCKILRY
ncbi:hypothetical protein AAC387_Pa08g1746 [Persea americana]